MDIELGIGVLSLPINYSCELVEIQGGSRQIFDNSNGSYTPDRTTSAGALILGTRIIINNPNLPDGQQQSEAAPSSVVWYYIDATGKNTLIDSSTNDFSIDNANKRLTVSRNIPDSQSGSRIRANINFSNPVTGETITIERDYELTTTVNTVNALSLIVEAGDNNDVAYAGETFIINPITNPLNKAGDNWRVRCNCQLYDGTTAIRQAYTGSNRNGNAFYFWYVRDRLGNLTRLTRNTDYLTGTVHQDGTWDSDVMVNMAKMYDITLVCRAGYIPYGELANYKDEAGLIQPSKCLLGFLEKSFHLVVRMPTVQAYEPEALANATLREKDFTADDTSTVIISRRMRITAGGDALNYLTNPLNDGRNLVDCLFDVCWYKVDKTTGARTLLQANSETLTTNLKALGATSASDLPRIVCTVKQKVPDLWGRNAVDGYIAEQEDVATEVIHGDTDFLNDRSFFLLDTTDNNNMRTKGVRLQKNNLLRYAGGGFAPTVGIKQEQYDECMTNDLYLKNDSNYVLCYRKGEYDPAKEWEFDKQQLKHGNRIRTIYKKSGASYTPVTWKLRPWETTETKYSIGYAFPYDVYVLDNVKGDSGMVWKGIFTDVTEWDGIDLTAYKIDASHTISLKLAPTAIGPTAYCTIGGNARTFFFAYEGETNCAGEAGNGGFITAFQGGKTYPRTSDVSQIECMTQSRANNKDTSAPYPFAECGWLPYSSLILSLELQAHTRDISNEDNGFGIGICNDQTPTAANFWKIGGVRYTVGSDTTYTYERWDTSKTFIVGGKSVTTNWSSLTNYERSKAQCMEPQMAASYAVELGIEPTTASGQEKTFEFYGGTYYYEDVALDGFTNILTGGMACRLYKIVTTSFTDDTKGKINIEYRLRMSLFDGLSLSGDIFTYCGGGHELVALHTGTKEQGESGYAVTEYFQPDVSKWHRETVDHKIGGAKFDFESSYIKLADSTTGGRWTKMHVAFGILPMSVNGAGWRKGDVAFLNTTNWFSSTDNDRTRLGLRFGGLASWTSAAPRSAFCIHSFRSAFRPIGGRAQALLAAQPQ